MPRAIAGVTPHAILHEVRSDDRPMRIVGSAEVTGAGASAGAIAREGGVAFAFHYGFPRHTRAAPGPERGDERSSARGWR